MCWIGHSDHWVCLSEFLSGSGIVSLFVMLMFWMYLLSVSYDTPRCAILPFRPDTYQKCLTLNGLFCFVFKFEICEICHFTHFFLFFFILFFVHYTNAAINNSCENDTSYYYTNNNLIELLQWSFYRSRPCPNRIHQWSKLRLVPLTIQTPHWHLKIHLEYNHGSISRWYQWIGSD